jgi:quercetin dioxygenase-like cupin family protein
MLPKEKRTMSRDHPLDELAGSRPAGRVSIPVVTTNIDTELEALRRSASYQRNDHASATIVNRPGLGVVLVALPKGGHMAEHRAARPIMLRVLEGRIRLTLRDQTLEMSAGDLTSLAPELAHEVSGVENSAFLLTIGGGARQTPSR